MTDSCLVWKEQTDDWRGSCSLVRALSRVHTMRSEPSASCFWGSATNPPWSEANHVGSALANRRSLVKCELSTDASRVLPRALTDESWYLCWLLSVLAGEAAPSSSPLWIRDSQIIISLNHVIYTGLYPLWAPGKFDEQREKIFTLWACVWKLSQQKSERTSFLLVFPAIQRII